LLDSITYTNSKQSFSLLILSNGHGEDVIAFEIIKKLIKIRKFKKIEVLPLVGEGKIFDSLKAKEFQKIGFHKVLPSGGFSNQSLRGFLLDLCDGFLIDLIKNWLIIRSKTQENYKIFAIGDLLPLFFAWSSNCRFGFMGTPKSDYTWSSGPGWSFSDLYHRLKGSEWDPWEISLMRSSRCDFVFMRDDITTRNLIKKRVRAIFLGNPMMDFIEFQNHDKSRISIHQKIILLIGSRYPEALRNFEVFLSCLDKFHTAKDLLIFVPLTNNSNNREINNILESHNFSQTNNNKFLLDEESTWRKQNKFLLLGCNTFNSWANLADVGIANAGTATEQLSGLGIPSLSLPGSGPQFTKEFANRQQRLLGGSVMVCKSRKVLISKLELLISNELLRNTQADVGRKRMGGKGASQRIVQYLNLNF